MRALGGESEAQLADRMHASGLIEKLAASLRPKLQQLSAAEAATGSELHNKFQQEGNAFELQYADLSVFFGGLEAQIGPPDTHVALAMEREHTEADDSRDEFTTGNCACRHQPLDLTDSHTPHIPWNSYTRYPTRVLTSQMV